MTTVKNLGNLIVCRYCGWRTLRFRGKKHNERHLRFHVLTEHEDAYKQAMGFVEIADDTPWMLDDDTRGEQPL